MGGRIEFTIEEVQKVGDVNRTVGECLKHLGKIDALINNVERVSASSDA
jgi:hypothetical protein